MQREVRYRGVIDFSARSNITKKKIRKKASFFSNFLISKNSRGHPSQKPLIYLIFEVDSL